MVGKHEKNRVEIQNNLILHINNGIAHQSSEAGEYLYGAHCRIKRSIVGGMSGDDDDDNGDNDAIVRENTNKNTYQIKFSTFMACCWDRVKGKRNEHKFSYNFFLC